MFEKQLVKKQFLIKKVVKIRSIFAEVLPEYDAERVYTSNIKKVIQWFNLLVNAGMDFSKIEASTEEVKE